MSGLDRLRQFKNHFTHTIWLNPVVKEEWRYTDTIGAIREIFPMFELTLDGLENAVIHIVGKH